MHSETHKIIVVGDSHVGKTSIVSKFLNEAVYSEYMPTVGVDFHTKMALVSADRVKFSIWDTSGQPAFRTIVDTFFESVAGCVAVYDVTDRATLHTVTSWVADVATSDVATSDLKVVLVGNKADLHGRRDVSTQEGLMTATRNGWQFAELEIGTPSDEIFANLSRAISNKLPPAAPPATPPAAAERECCCRLGWLSDAAKRQAKIGT